MKGIVLIALAGLLPVLSGMAQTSAPAVTLEQSIAAALANGDDNKLLQANLDLGKAQHAENVSKNSWALGGSAAGGYNLPGGNSALLVAKESTLTNYSTSAQGTLLGIGVNGPLTAATVSVSPWVPPVQPLGTVPSGDTDSIVALNVTQTVWNGYPGGPAQAVVDKSLLSLQGKQLATDSGRLTIVFRVKQAYYTMLAAQQDAVVTRQILDKQNALLAQITTVYNLKQASDVDLKTAQINARSAQVDVENADHSLRIARIQLAILMGRSTEDEFSVEQQDSLPLPAASLPEAISLALSHRTDFQQLELSRKSNSVDLALAKGQGTPTVSLTGGVAEIFDWTATSAWLVNAGVKVAMPILDAGAVKYLVDAALKQDEIYALQERQLQKSIAATIQNDWEAVQIQNERVEVARLTAENDDLLVEVYRIQNQNGTASTQDLLTASVNAASAHTAYVQAQSNAQLAVLQLLSDMGY
ncbi:MAG: TolC family protein [Spirochaetia bacterium]|jgi:outer membrane protein TolC